MVGDCVAAMKAAVAIPVTVKCRIGVDEQDPEEALDALADAVFAAGADVLWVHARKAWLKGLSPKENRDVPPLDYGRVYRLKATNPDRFIVINGGIRTLDEAARASRACRRRHARPRRLPDARACSPMPTPRSIGEAPRADGLGGADRDHGGLCCPPYCRRRAMSHVTRHMVGLFHGLPGARRYRQISRPTRRGRGRGRTCCGRRSRRSISAGRAAVFLDRQTTAAAQGAARFLALSKMFVSVELMPSISRMRRSVSSKEARSRSSISATKSQRPLVQ